MGEGEGYSSAGKKAKPGLPFLTYLPPFRCSHDMGPALPTSVLVAGRCELLSWQSGPTAQTIHGFSARSNRRVCQIALREGETAATPQGSPVRGRDSSTTGPRQRQPGPQAACLLLLLSIIEEAGTCPVTHYLLLKSVWLGARTDAGVLRCSGRKVALPAWTKGLWNASFAQRKEKGEKGVGKKGRALPSSEPCMVHDTGSHRSFTYQAYPAQWDGRHRFQ